MKMKEFQSLPGKEQVKILYEQGVYIGKKYGKYISLLYQLEGFYVEIFYRNYRKHICNIRYSDSALILDPYLEQIPIQVEFVL